MATESEKKAVLVVDDDEDIVIVLEDFLRESGYHVDVSYDGLDALTCMRSHHYDAVVCDMMMPRMNGERLYREVEGSMPWMTRRFLFVTGMSSPHEHSRFFNDTSVRHLEKPFHAEDVIREVQEIIKEDGN